MRWHRTCFWGEVGLMPGCRVPSGACGFCQVLFVFPRVPSFSFFGCFLFFVRVPSGTFGCASGAVGRLRISSGSCRVPSRAFVFFFVLLFSVQWYSSGAFGCVSGAVGRLQILSGLFRVPSRAFVLYHRKISVFLFGARRVPSGARGVPSGAFGFCRVLVVCLRVPSYLFFVCFDFCSGTRRVPSSACRVSSGARGCSSGARLGGRRPEEPLCHRFGRPTQLRADFWNKQIPRTDFSFIITLQSAHTCVFYIGNMCISETNQFLEQTFRSLLPSSRLTNVCFTQEICVFLKQTNSSNRVFVHYYPPVGSQMCVLHRKYVYFWNKQIPRSDFSFIITLQSAHKCVFYIENMCISETNQFLEQTFRSLLPSSRLTNVVLHRTCVFLKQANSSNRLFVHYYPPVGSQMCVLHRKYVYFWNKPIPQTDFSFIITLQSAHKCVFYIGNMCISETNQFLEQTFRSLLPSSRLTNVCFT